MALVDKIGWLVALNEASGNRAPAKGTTAAIPTGSPGNAVAVIDHGVALDGGVPSYLTAANGADTGFGSGDFWCAFWIKHPTYTTGEVFYKDGNSTGFFYRQSAGQGVVGINDSGTFQVSTGNVMFTDTWYWVLIQYNATTGVLSISLNGGTPITASGVSAPAGTGALSIGNASSGFTGTIEQFIWGNQDSLPTSDEIAYIYNGGAGHTAADILAYGISDSSPPTLTSAALAGSGDRIALSFSETVITSGSFSDGWTVKINGSTVTIDSVAGANADWTLFLHGPVRIGDTVSIAYSSSTGSITDAASNALATIVTQSVSNTSTRPIHALAPNHSGFQWTGNWYLTGSAAIGNTSGPRLRFRTTSTRVTLAIDTTKLVGLDLMPTLYVSVNGGSYTAYPVAQLDEAIQIASGLSGTTDIDVTARLEAKSVVGVSYWDSTATIFDAVKITAIELDNTTPSSPAVAPSASALFLGDSITFAANISPVLGWARLVANHFNWLADVSGFCSQGWNQAGIGGVPNFQSSPFLSYYNGVAKDISHYDYIVVNHGINGTTIAADVKTAMEALRAANSTAFIIIIDPAVDPYPAPSPTTLTAIATGFANYRTAYPSDTRVTHLTGLTIDSGNFQVDNVHPTAAGHAQFAAQIESALSSIITPPTPPMPQHTIACPNPSGTAPYSYQWYHSRVSGFTPGVGNIMSGETKQYIAAALPTSGTHYYRCVITDSAGTPVVTTSSEFAYAPANLYVSNDALIPIRFTADTELYNRGNVVHIATDRADSYVLQGVAVYL